VADRPENFVSTVRALAVDAKLDVVVGAPSSLSLEPFVDRGLEHRPFGTAPRR
jgi:hypothetical protein